MTDINLTGKTCIVTGGGRGLGRSMVHALAGAGANVMAAMHINDNLEEDTKDLPGQVKSMVTDIRDPSNCARIVHDTISEFGKLDVLVNNAGYGSYGAVEDISIEEARRQFEVNVFGLAQMTNAVLPTMRAQRSGRIIHIGSVGGKLWSLLGGWYQATKFALEGFSDCTRNELRPFGIDVVLIEPSSLEYCNICRF